MLDVTAEAAEYAAQNGIDLIVSHHPVIFNPLKKLETESVPYFLAKHDIAVISAHKSRRGKGRSERRFGKGFGA